MQHLQRIPKSPVLEVSALVGSENTSRGRISPAELPGAGVKRDYAGVLEYWQMVRRHRAAVILATLLGGLLAFASTLPALRIYQARTTLEIQGVNDDFVNCRNVNP